MRNASPLRPAVVPTAPPPLALFCHARHGLQALLNRWAAPFPGSASPSPWYASPPPPACGGAAGGGGRQRAGGWWVAACPAGPTTHPQKGGCLGGARRCLKKAPQGGVRSASLPPELPPGPLAVLAAALRRLLPPAHTRGKGGAGWVGSRGALAGEEMPAGRRCRLLPPEADGERWGKGGLAAGGLGSRGDAGGSAALLPPAHI